MGRPSKYTDEIAADIVKDMRDGLTRECAAARAGITGGLFSQWMSKGMKGIEPFAAFSKDLNFGFYDATFGYWMGSSSSIINTGLDQCNQMFPTHDGGYIAVGFNTMIVDGQNAVNGGANVFVLKKNTQLMMPVTTDTVFTLNQLVETIELNQTMVELTMYPNPTSNELHVSLSEQVSGAYTVCDLMGKCLLTGKIQSNFTIETATWNQGVYFLNIGQHSFKFIKQ